MKRRKKIELLLGRWEPCDPSSSVILEISKAGRSVGVRAFDRDDGEELAVSKVRWDGTSLRFETLVKSTRWRTRNSLRPLSRTRLVQEITFWEPWRKLRLRTAAKDPGDT
jgi:hypothetical protein